MLKTLLAQVKQYKKSSLLTPLFAALEVVMEVLIPFITAMIIDQGIGWKYEKSWTIWKYHVGICNV